MHHLLAFLILLSRPGHQRCMMIQQSSITVAILAQGTSWAVAVTQAFLPWRSNPTDHEPLTTIDELFAHSETMHWPVVSAGMCTGLQCCQFCLAGHLSESFVTGDCASLGLHWILPAGGPRILTDLAGDAKGYPHDFRSYRWISLGVPYDVH
jgi:hypothetical protein